MNTIIICSTIVICLFIICYYVNKFAKRAMENDSTINSIFNDIDTIKEIVDRITTIECYNDTIKHNLLTVKNIVSKYVEETETSVANLEED